jgi:thiol:disulfide interchange protein DsbD
MALTLALVSFSCTGPILGTLLVGALSSDGGVWQLTSGMAGFGLGLALPFGIFAAFPGFMSSLPKSGGWLNTVKVTLGFLELALALKFLSNADMVKHWGILKVELFLGLWIVIFAALALYLFGIIRLPHDSKGQKIPLAQKILGGLSAAFVIYLATGFSVNQEMGSYRPLKLLSGLAPPVCYSYFQPCDCPQQLTCFKDLKEGLAYAKKQNKPVLLDFTGYACVNCRKMEEHVWPEPEVYPYLKDDFVLISLYVDDRKELPEEQQLRVETFQGTKTLRTYGNKWSYFQETYFNAVAQPYYVLVTPDLELLNAPAAYTPDKREYAQFLECGKQTYNSLAER